jgi:sterol desaturase/sphingolipid hydroxylase (fatty acid hydroxylase superfamily)
MDNLIQDSPALQWTQIAFGLVVVLFALTEFLRRRQTGMGYDLGAFSGTLGVAIGFGLSKALTGGMVGAALMGFHALAPVQFAIDDWRAWVIGFFALEFCYYWQHRFMHTVRWYWASHSVHHSPQEFTLPAALRLSWTSAISGSWIFYIPMALIGIHPLVIGTLMVLNLQYQYFLHTELVGKLGPLEWVFNTPSHHRVHHGSNPAYLDKNFGGVLIVFDRMFGSFAEEREDEPVRYGLTKPVTSNNPFVIVFHEWARMVEDLRRARSWRDVWTITCGRPGAHWPSENFQAAKGLRSTAV